MNRRVIVIVADGLGIGGAPDAAAFGDEGADTLGHLVDWAQARGQGLQLPTLVAWGSTRLCPGLFGEERSGLVSRLVSHAAAKDSTVGHWELMGLVSGHADPLYPDGFPPDVVGPFEAAIGRSVLGNVASSGTEILKKLGPAHVASGSPIVYTSGDSVFQIATHVDVVPLEVLYQWCETARSQLQHEHAVGRVIARPFSGGPPDYRRLPLRKDWSLPVPGTTALDVLSRAGVPTIGIGKIEDLFGRAVLSASFHDGDNPTAMARTLEHCSTPVTGWEFVFVNLVEFDSSWGHRRDPEGFARGLESLDQFLFELAGLLGDDDFVFVSGDHGNDPTWTSTTDHTRERVPLIGWGPALDGRGVTDFGCGMMSDVGATVCSLLGVEAGELEGTPLLLR